MSIIIVSILFGGHMDSLILRIGNQFKKARKEKGYTTEEVAHLLEISTGKLNNIENGKNDCFQLELVNKVSEILDVDIYKIGGGTFYSNEENYREYDEFIRKIITFFKENTDDMNSELIKKVDGDINFINGVKKAISES